MSDNVVENPIVRVPIFPSTKCNGKYTNLAITTRHSLPKLNIPWTEWLIYSVLLKWGKNTDLSVTNKYFYYAHPVVAPKGKLDISDVNIDEISTTGNDEFIIDDLDNIDDLIADAIDDELFEELI